MDFDTKYDITTPVPLFSMKKDRDTYAKKLNTYPGTHTWNDEKGIHIDLGDILFDTDSSRLRPDAKSVIKYSLCRW